MKITAIIKKIISSACVIFTLLFSLTYTLGVTVNADWIPTLSMMYSLLAFAFVLSCMNVYLFSNRLVLGLRLLIHYAVCAVSFYVLFIVASGFAKNGGSALPIMIAFSVIYALFAAIVAVFKGTSGGEKKKKAQKSTEYKSMFK